MAASGLVERRVGAMLAAIGLDSPVIAIEPLSGGVSSDVFKVALGDRTVCVKFAIERLRVASNWRAPVCRNEAEYHWLRQVGAWLPDAVPQVFGHDAARHGLAMAFLPPDTHSNWKADLLGGRIDEAVAAAVGARLAAIHARSTACADLAALFSNAADFEALRLDPYLRFTADRHPALAARLDALADAQGAARIALVHGDVSPKNILCGPSGPVFIDAECATFGDPVFDLAFVLNHLAIKALVLSDGAALLRSARALWAAYRDGIDWEPRDAAEARTAALLPALMLARVDGKSPLEYLTGETAARVRNVAIALLASAPVSIDGLLSAIEEGRR